LRRDRTGTETIGNKQLDVDGKDGQIASSCLSGCNGQIMGGPHNLDAVVFSRGGRGLTLTVRHDRQAASATRSTSATPSSRITAIKPVSV
jgi:hypothetical protein